MLSHQKLLEKTLKVTPEVGIFGVCVCDKTDAKADANASLFLLLHVSCIASHFP